MGAEAGGEVDEDGCGGAPDVVAFVGPDPVVAFAAAELAAAALGGGGVEEGCEGEGKDFGDLVGAGGEDEAFGEKADDRGDEVSGAGDVVGEAAGDLDVAGGEADFFFGFAEGGGFGGDVFGLDTAAGEGDLAGVGGEVGGAEGEEDARLVAVEDGHEDGGGAERAGYQVRGVVGCGKDTDRFGVGRFFGEAPAECRQLHPVRTWWVRRGRRGRRPHSRNNRRLRSG